MARPIAVFSSPTQFMAQRKTTIDEAYAGDIIGLPDNGTFKIGDTLTEGEPAPFPRLAQLLAGDVRVCRKCRSDEAETAGKGYRPVDGRRCGTVVCRSDFSTAVRLSVRSDGPASLSVIQYRLLNEYNASCRWEPVSLYKACWVESRDDPAELEAFKKRKYQYMAKDREGRDVFLAGSGYVLQMAQMDFKHIKFHFTSEF